MKNDTFSKYSVSELTELLTFASISIEEVFENAEMKANKKILEDHKFNIYYSEHEKAWRTYLPDESKPAKRKALKRATRENLEKDIIKFYKEKALSANRSRITLERLYAEWMLYRRDHTSTKPKTIQENACDWNRFIKNTSLAKMSVCDIQTITLIRFFRKLTKNRDITHKRISNLRSVLNGIFSYAIEEEIILHNPIRDINFSNFTYKPLEHQAENVFSFEDVQILLTYLKDKNDVYALAISLFFYLFIRIGEFKAMKWSDIDFENRTIYLHNQLLVEYMLNDDLSFSNRTLTLSDQMKGCTSKGYRKQYLTDEALSILKKAKEINPDGEFIFMPNGQPMANDSFNRNLKRFCQECNVEYHSSHKIRFYNASTAYDGKNLSTISKLMGHTTVETTIHYLRHVDRSNDEHLAYSKLGLITENSVQTCSN